MILWRSPTSGIIFVIDGAHRLSALIAWVRDDYGDKHASLRFFDNEIPLEQKRAAEATRKLINDSVGSYVQLSLALRNSDTAAKDQLRLARNMSAFAINLQWVHGEAEKAESSFFRINQQATPIEPTELDMIRDRRKPNALAARAFIRAGTGHKYWSAFDDETKNEIEKIAKDVYDLLFRPALDSSLRTSDLPAAGRSYSADSIRMVFELVNFVSRSRVHPDMRRGATTGRHATKSADPTREILADDLTGVETLKFMRAVKRVASRISGNGAASLGLHPAVYFYSATGRFQPAAFLAIIEFVRELDEKGRLPYFTESRANFEEFLVKHKYFLNQIAQRYGSMQKSVSPMLTMYRVLLKAVGDDKDDDSVIAEIKSQSTLGNTIKEISDGDRKYGRNFSAETKNMVHIKSMLDSSVRCGICGARLPANATSFDHKIRKEDGGIGAPENAQLAHPYCNTGYKEGRHAATLTKEA